jgi:hypothetical protein
MMPPLADMLLNQPVRLPDGTVWTYRKRSSDLSAEHARERENKRKRDANARARQLREAKV